MAHMSIPPLYSKRKRLEELNGALEDEGIWSRETNKAGAMVKEAAQLAAEVGR